MFGEERLDPHGVGNLPHVLTITKKSFTFGVRGRVECPYYLCFNKVPVYFWSSFKLKREQEISVEIKTWLSCSRPHVGRDKYYKCM